MITKAESFLKQYSENQGWQLQTPAINSELIFYIAGREFPGAGKLWHSGHQVFEYLYGEDIWNQTWDQTVVFQYNETVNLDQLLELHRIISSQSCNINNIVVVGTGNWGVGEWWRQYCQLLNITSFRWLDLPLHGSWFYKYLEPGTDTGILEQVQNKTLEKTFCYVGGNVQFQTKNQEKDFLYLLFKKENILSNMTLAGDTRSLKQDVIDYAETITGFVDQPLVESIDQAYQEYIVDTQPIREINSNMHRIQYWQSDRQQMMEEQSFRKDGFFADITQDAWITVVRETYNTTPFCSATEKSIWPLLWGTSPVNCSWKQNSFYRAMGMEIPWIDESTQQNINYTRHPVTRWKRIIKFLQLHKDTSIRVREENFKQNLSKFEHNIQCFFSGNVFENLQYEFIKQCEI